VQELKDILDVMLTDNRHAWELNEAGEFIQRTPGDDGDQRSTHDLLMERTLKRDRGGTIDSIA
jgi:polyphosphate kinase